MQRLVCLAYGHGEDIEIAGVAQLEETRPPVTGKGDGLAICELGQATYAWESEGCLDLRRGTDGGVHCFAEKGEGKAHE